MSDTPTHDEIMKVRRHECSMQGHDWDIMGTIGSQDPHGLICRRCGRNLTIHTYVTANG